MTTPVSTKLVPVRPDAMGVVASAPEAVPRNTLYDVAPVLAVQLSVTWLLPAVAVRPAGGCGAVTAALIVRVKVAEPVPVELVAVMVTALVPAVVGVPLIRPAVFTVNPSGSPLAPKLVGFWLATIW